MSDALEVNEDALVGTWCEYSPLSIGKLVTEEFTFSSDQTFHWRRIEIAEDDDVDLRSWRGNWCLEDERLKLAIETRETNMSPCKRIHFSVGLRTNAHRRQLVLKTTLYDDENQEGKHGF